MATQDDRIIGFNLCAYTIESDGTIYIGSTRHDGSVLIQRFINNEMRYFIAVKDFSSVWDDRLTHEYKYYHEVF